MEATFEFTPAELDSAWALLSQGIESGQAPGTLNDWMLMYQKSNTFAFKHRDTRNYICVGEDGRVFIPKLNRHFMRGEFA